MVEKEQKRIDLSTFRMGIRADNKRRNKRRNIGLGKENRGHGNGTRSNDEGHRRN